MPLLQSLKNLQNVKIARVFIKQKEHLRMNAS